MNQSVTIVDANCVRSDLRNECARNPMRTFLSHTWIFNGSPRKKSSALFSINDTSLLEYKTQIRLSRLQCVQRSASDRIPRLKHNLAGDTINQNSLQDDRVVCF